MQFKWNYHIIWKNHTFLIYTNNIPAGNDKMRRFLLRVWQNSYVIQAYLMHSFSEDKHFQITLFISKLGAVGKYVFTAAFELWFFNHVLEVILILFIYCRHLEKGVTFIWKHQRNSWKISQKQQACLIVISTMVRPFA